MTTYRWTFTCEEMYDDENQSVNITTKTLVSDSETFTDVLILLPQLFNGVGFFVKPLAFTYEDETFEDWACMGTEVRSRVTERKFSPPGFVGDFSRWTEPPYRYAADPGIQMTGGCMGDGVDELAGFPPTTSEE